MFSERLAYIVWIRDLKAAGNLEKYGTIHYVSRRMFYVVMYVNADEAERIMKTVRGLPYVRQVERSYRGQIRAE